MHISPYYKLYQSVESILVGDILDRLGEMFISFEGIEGCGKSTQAKRLKDRLSELGIPVIATREPGGTRIGQDIRRILLDSRNRNLSPLAELLLYAADRAQHVEEVIGPAIDAGKWVICDRFFDATVVYQGYARGLDLSLTRSLNEKAVSGVKPHKTILLDCPVEVGLKRALYRTEIMQQEAQARFEREKKDFHEAVRKGYLEIAGREPDRFLVMDGTLNEDELEKLIFGHLNRFIVKGGGS
jgi:dTMP kinase